MLEILIGILILLILVLLTLQLKHSKKDDEPTVSHEVNYLTQQISKLENDKTLLQSEKEQLLQENSTLKTSNKTIEHQLSELKQENKTIAEQLKNDFKILAADIMESKSQKFTEINKSNIDSILSPLKEKLKSFEEKVDKTYTTELKDRNTLKVQIDHLVELNQRLSQDASNLTNALKGDVKIQGNWGENLLEKILEHTGLQKDIHYYKEHSINDSENNRKRLDFIVNLPENKQIIIDSKVSLVAYEAFYSSSSKEDKESHLKALITSIKSHIDGLSKKDYQQIHDINSPDYVIMFIAIEPAYMIALQEDHDLYQYAWNKNILLVSPSNLTAILKTVNYIWKQDGQNKNVKEIARIGGTMYDKFKGFLDDMESIKKSLDRSSESYDKAMNKLSSGRGNLIGQAEKIKSLGAETSKQITMDHHSELSE